MAKYKCIQTFGAFSPGDVVELVGTASPAYFVPVTDATSNAATPAEVAETEDEKAEREAKVAQLEAQITELEKEDTE